MTLLNYTTSLVAGTPEDINDVQSMFNQVAAVVNNLDNDNIAPLADIDYSKLDLTGQVVNADVSSAADIALSKLAPVTAGRLVMGNASNDAAAVAMSGDVAISPTGTTTIQPGAVDTAELAAQAVETDQLANSGVVSGKYVLGTGQGVGTGGEVSLPTTQTQQVTTSSSLAGGFWLAIGCAQVNVGGGVSDIAKAQLRTGASTYVGTEGWSEAAGYNTILVAAIFYEAAAFNLHLTAWRGASSTASLVREQTWVYAVRIA